ncbi:MAG TPA: enoyl-CoA hydratase-related protein [Bacillota bacterium]
MEQNQYETVIYDEKHRVATITLNRPSAYNAFTPQMNKEIIETLKRADRNEEIRSIVITGQGNAFCAGEDLGSVDHETNHATLLRERYHPMINMMKKVTKPIVAAVNGTAAGAGMSLALAADFRLVHRETKFISAFMGIGLVPDSGFMYMLPRLIGYAKALEIAVLGIPISGEEAKKIGLATKVIEKDEWAEQVQSFSQSLAQMPTTAFSLIKRYMMDGMHTPFTDALEQEAQAQRIAGMSKDHQEGLRAFKEKREPVYTGN